MDSVIYLYGHPSLPLGLPALAAYLEKWGLPATVRPDFVEYWGRGHEEDLAWAFARARIRRLQGPPMVPLVKGDSRRSVPFNKGDTHPPSPLPGEVDYERRRLAHPERRLSGLLYDGLPIMTVFRDLISREERGLGSTHIILTDQLFGTWEEDDARYHARAAIFGFPSIVSTTGLVEAPARPREYYLLKQQYGALGLGDAMSLALKRDFQARALVPDDPRLTEAAKGYLMQAAFYHLEGEAFCPEKSCRLYNAHWQEEVMAAQLKAGPEFCPRHEAILEGWRTSPPRSPSPDAERGKA